MGTGEQLTGEQYGRRMHAPTEHYRMDSQIHAYKKWIIEYIKKSKMETQLKKKKCDRDFRSQEDFADYPNVGCPIITNPMLNTGVV